MAIQHKRLRAIGDLADVRVPQRLAGEDVVRHQIAATVARKQQLAGSSQQSAATTIAIIWTLPDHFAGFVIDGGEEAAARPTCASSLPPRPIDPRGSTSVR
jgi:hypothetical protein